MPEHKPTTDEAREAVRTLIAFIGDDPDRDGLRDTPARVLRAWQEAWGSGYRDDAAEILTSFENDGDHDQMIVLREISYHSHCEHHLATFYGSASVAYLPRGRIIGVSKLARIVEHFASRLQVQERLTRQIADFMAEHISPDCAASLDATHMCMTSRGVRQPRAVMTTTALRGIFRDDPAAQQEFISRIARR